jgi:hypothetical protein
MFGMKSINVATRSWNVIRRMNTVSAGGLSVIYLYTVGHCGLSDRSLLPLSPISVSTVWQDRSPGIIVQRIEENEQFAANNWESIWPSNQESLKYQSAIDAN